MAAHSTYGEATRGCDTTTTRVPCFRRTHQMTSFRIYREPGLIVTSVERIPGFALSKPQRGFDSRLSHKIKIAIRARTKPGRRQ
jgi:hypothetical protein